MRVDAIHALDIPPLAKLQHVVSLSVPVVVAFVIVRFVIITGLNIFVATAKRIIPSFDTFLQFAARVERAAERAGTVSSLLCYVLAGVTGITDIFEESDNCKPATVARPHALILTGACIGLLATSNFYSNAANVCAIIMFSRRSPLAWMCALIAFIEWTTPRGFKLEICAFLAYIVAFLATVMHVSTCGKGHVSTDSILGSLSYIGCASWAVTIITRTVAEQRWKRD
jgi:hypothetical protein